MESKTNIEPKSNIEKDEDVSCEMEETDVTRCCCYVAEPCGCEYDPYECDVDTYCC